MEVLNTNAAWKIAAFIILLNLRITRFGRISWLNTVCRSAWGTIILADEGINSTCSGSEDAIDRTIALIRSDERFKDMEVKYSYADFCPFPKFKVKKKAEIVTFRQSGADPRDSVGEYLEPEDWNALISDPEVITIDTRNDYEVKVGQFRGAINPKTDDFTSFAEFVDTQLAEHKEKKIAMYCTGGIRCERSTAYLRKGLQSGLSSQRRHFEIPRIDAQGRESMGRGLFCF